MMLDGLGCYPKPVFFSVPSDAQTALGTTAHYAVCTESGNPGNARLEGPAKLTECNHLLRADPPSAASTTAEDTGSDTETETS